MRILKETMGKKGIEYPSIFLLALTILTMSLLALSIENSSINGNLTGKDNSSIIPDNSSNINNSGNASSEKTSQEISEVISDENNSVNDSVNETNETEEVIENSPENVTQEDISQLNENKSNGNISIPESNNSEIFNETNLTDLTEKTPLIVKEEPVQGKIIIGKPVFWSQKIKVINSGNFTLKNYSIPLEIPQYAFNVSVEVINVE